MFADLSLLARFCGISLRMQMQYRISFLLQIVGRMLLSITDFLALWMLFDRFETLIGWNFAEVALFYAVTTSSFAIASLFGHGFSTFSNEVRSGDFDRVLLRPRPASLQILGKTLQMNALGRILQALVIGGWALHNLDVVWSFGDTVLLSWTIAAGCCLWLGILIVQASFAFWSTEGLEIFNAITYGGAHAASYPLSIYSAELRTLFTWIVPVASVCYFPVLQLCEHADPLGSPWWWQISAPICGPIFLLLALCLWRLGVSRYTSTGS